MVDADDVVGDAEDGGEAQAGRGENCRRQDSPQGEQCAGPLGRVVRGDVTDEVLRDSAGLAGSVHGGGGRCAAKRGEGGGDDIATTKARRRSVCEAPGESVEVRVAGSGGAQLLAAAVLEAGQRVAALVEAARRRRHALASRCSGCAIGAGARELGHGRADVLVVLVADAAELAVDHLDELLVGSAVLAVLVIGAREDGAVGNGAQALATRGTCVAEVGGIRASERRCLS